MSVLLIPLLLFIAMVASIDRSRRLNRRDAAQSRSNARVLREFRRIAVKEPDRIIETTNH